MAVTRFEMHDFADVVEPGTMIRAGQPAEVSIAALRPGVAQRVIDFFSGVAVTGSATMSRISPGLFLITPPAPAEPLLSLPRSRRTAAERPFWPEDRRG